VARRIGLLRRARIQSVAYEHNLVTLHGAESPTQARRASSQGTKNLQNQKFIG
jgi:hypothetical protein